ncbi:OprD family outer membrane porin [Parendozoicomonas sp. Alg238-R29]|uniref:OprD family outer membrane porin n=1 Tax=Parendozoicomonas sp. Alg238-R29 TaxID=2993446 RepID=UPI00248EDFE7|nr:OprD family outer membrane porin [Parendozoicomonas sp. Alg238-R29]
MFRKNALPLAIATAIAASSAAQANFSNLYEDATVGGKLRTVYIEADKKDGGTDAGAWTVSADITVKSGWAYDMFGFDASYYGAMAINDGNTNDPKNLLTYGDKDGFSKLGQAYLKGKFGSKDMGASFKAGRTRIYTGLISGSGSRSIPSSWQGIDTDFNFNGLNVGVAWVNAVLPRDTPDMKWIENSEGERIDNILGMEASYKFDNGLSLKYMNGFAKDFVESHQFIAKKGYELSNGNKLTVEGNYRVSEENGKLWTGQGGYGSSDSGFGDKAQTYDFNVKYGMGAAYVRAGLGYTKADSYSYGGREYTGRHYYDFGKYSYGAWNTWTNSGLIEEFYYDGEKVIALGAGYDFADMGIPGLTVDYKFRYGSGIDLSQGGSASETEHGIDVKYKFQSVKGLSTRIRYAIYNQDDLVYATKNGAASKAETDENQLRVYLDYKF